MVGCLAPPRSKGSPPHASGGVTEGDLSNLLDIPGGGVSVVGDPIDTLPCKSSCQSIKYGSKSEQFLAEKNSESPFNDT